MSLWLIIPVKSLAAGKGRLAAALTAEQRRQLNEQLLRHVLGVAPSVPGKQRTILVSRCPEALALGHSHGVQVLQESGEGGLNSAVQQGSDCARAAGASSIMVLHADLPGVRAQDIEALCSAARVIDGVAIATDRAGSGTNALCLPAAKPFSYRFGPDSRNRHEQEASLQFLPAVVVHIPGLAFDLDTVQDLSDWTGLQQGPALQDVGLQKQLVDRREVRIQR
jgi:2-phospho-L-lactate guanylyltransferase